MRTNANCTLYQKSVDATTRGEKWTRVAIKRVCWESRKAANVLASGLLEADQATIYIPFARGSIHIAPGDVIVRGIAMEEITTTTFTVSALKRAYADALTVRSVDTILGGSRHLHHWQVGAG